MIIFLTDSVRGEFQAFTNKSAGELYRSIKEKIINLGLECIKEFSVLERGNFYFGRVDLLISNQHRNHCEIKIDSISAREKSFTKLPGNKIRNNFIARKSSTSTVR
ncbi:MAG: hypothetical protein ACTS73_06105 [Arsenophonus sp. NEOnobi-MAG3]